MAKMCYQLRDLEAVLDINHMINLLEELDTSSTLVKFAPPTKAIMRYPDWKDRYPHRTGEGNEITVKDFLHKNELTASQCDLKKDGTK
nr:hypothetical transcript [Hymenolepis microstoma]